MVTFELACKLKQLLLDKSCELQIYDKSELCNLWNIYESIWRPFGQLLVEMESNGFHIDAEYLKKLETESVQEKTEYLDEFVKWAEYITNDPNMKYINPQSRVQLGYFFFGDDKDEVVINYGSKAMKENPELKAKKSFHLSV